MENLNAKDLELLAEYVRLLKRGYSREYTKGLEAQLCSPLYASAPKLLISLENAIRLLRESNLSESHSIAIDEIELAAKQAKGE